MKFFMAFSVIVFLILGSANLQYSNEKNYKGIKYNEYTIDIEDTTKTFTNFLTFDGFVNSIKSSGMYIFKLIGWNKSLDEIVAEVVEDSSNWFRNAIADVGAGIVYIFTFQWLVPSSNYSSSSS